MQKSLTKFLCQAIVLVGLIGFGGIRIAPCQDDPQVTDLGEIQGADEMTPALSYAFDDALQAPVYQNGAYHYQRAMRLLRDFDRQNQEGQYPWETEWLSDELVDWPTASVAKMLGRTSRVFDEIEVASRCHVCDWNIRIDSEDRLADIISTELDEIQETRRLARYLAIYTRHFIELGEFDQAAEGLRCMYQLSRDCQESPWIVSGLVGAAVHGIANGLVEQWIAKEGSPNLYWALATLGDRPQDIGQSVVGEVRSVFGGIEAFQNPETKDLTSEEWVSLLARDLGFILTPQSEERVTVQGKLMVTALLTSSYSVAKRELVELGYTAEQVEEMPVGQVVSIYQAQELDHFLHDVVKWTYIKSPRGYSGFLEAATAAEQSMSQSRGRSILAVVVNSLVPAYRAIGYAELRVNRHHAGLMAVEAVRMHYAQTGKLPKSLADIECVPAPHDPLTGEPFELRDDGESVTIVVPGASPYAARDYRFSK